MIGLQVNIDTLMLVHFVPFDKEFVNNGIPTYKDTCSNNPLTFSNCGGYLFAHTYIEYLDVTYGWDNVLALIETEDFSMKRG